MGSNFTDQLKLDATDENLLTASDLARLKDAKTVAKNYLASTRVDDDIAKFVIAHYDQLTQAFASLLDCNFHDPPKNLGEMRRGIAQSKDDVTAHLRRAFKKPTWDTVEFMKLQILYLKFADHVQHSIEKELGVEVRQR